MDHNQYAAKVLRRGKGVEVARDIAQQFRQTHVIILLLDDEGGTIEYASYGKDRARCDQARKLADVAYDAVLKSYPIT